MEDTLRELSNIENELDELRVARYKRGVTTMLSTVLAGTTILSASAEGSALAICMYMTMATLTVSSQISMSQLKERRETLTHILFAEKEKLTKKTSAQ